MFRFTPPPHLAIKSSLIAVSVALSAFSLNAHALAVTNVTYSVGSLTNLSVNSASSSPFKTVVSSDVNTRVDSSSPYTKVTDDKKGTITIQTLQDREEVVVTTTEKYDEASASYNLNTTTNAASIFRFNTTLSLDQAQTRSLASPTLYFSVRGNIVGGSALSDVPGLTAYQAPVFAMSINGHNYFALDYNLSTHYGSFHIFTNIITSNYYGHVESDGTLDMSFLVYTSQELRMNSFDFVYMAYPYNKEIITTTNPLTPTVLNTVITTYEVSPIPEPEYGAMLLAGLAVVGAATRRQAKNA